MSDCADRVGAEIDVSPPMYRHMCGGRGYGWGAETFTFEVHSGEWTHRHSGVRPIFENGKVRFVLDDTTWQSRRRSNHRLPH